jgi:hypothetical protein
MNTKQKIIALTGIAVILLMSLFPPWKIIAENPNASSQLPAGYYCIFSPPLPPASGDEEETEEYISIVLDLSRLAVQWITALFVLAALLYLTQDKAESDSAGEEDLED